MSLSAPDLIKKFLKPVFSIAACIITWFLLLIYCYIKKYKGNYIPAYLASLCFGDYLIHIINPQLIKYHIADPDNMPGNLFIWDGQWDSDIVPVENYEKFVMIKELFIEGKRFEETKFYLYAKKQMDKGYSLNRGDLLLDSDANLNLYFKKTEKLFQDIKDRGFDLKLAPETGVAIGADGQLIHYRQGHHSFAIAMLLSKKDIKIRIRAVHSDWLKKQMNNKKLPMLKRITQGFKNLFD